LLFHLPPRRPAQPDRATDQNVCVSAEWIQTGTGEIVRSRGAPGVGTRQDVELPAGGLGAVVPLLAYARQSRGDIVIAMVKLDHYHTHERLAMMAAKLGLPQSFTVRRAVPRLLPVAHRPRMHRRRAVRAPDEVNRVEV
jgi:hypothetical protein